MIRRRMIRNQGMRIVLVKSRKEESKPTRAVNARSGTRTGKIGEDPGVTGSVGRAVKRRRNTKTIAVVGGLKGASHTTEKVIGSTENDIEAPQGIEEGTGMAIERGHHVHVHVRQESIDIGNRDIITDLPSGGGRDHQNRTEKSLIDPTDTDDVLPRLKMEIQR
jgi:hypothetical protein